MLVNGNLVRKCLFLLVGTKRTAKVHSKGRDS